MKCIFCDREESGYVELVAWNYKGERARELLLRGVCMEHYAAGLPHPHAVDLFPLGFALRDRIPRLKALHRSQFKLGYPGFTGEALDYGMRFFPYDSLEGGMVRAARGGHVDTTKAAVHVPKVDFDVLGPADYAEAVSEAEKV